MGLLGDIERHEALAKRRSLELHRLYLEACDKRAAGRLLDDFAAGRIGYSELLQRLRRLANRCRGRSPRGAGLWGGGP